MWNIHTYGFEMGNVNHGLAMVYENDGGTLQVVKNMIYLSLDGYLLFFSQFFFVRFVFF